jgi:hypothetical protein
MAHASASGLSHSSRGSCPGAYVQSIAENWKIRATVGAHAARAMTFELEDEKSDYPLALTPFAEHPKFQSLPDLVKEKVLTFAWLAYNQRTVTAEVTVANPAFELIMAGHFPGADDGAMRLAIQQSIVDESFHTLLHRQAIEATLVAREVEPIGHCESVTARRLKQAQAECDDNWERDLLLLVFAIVSEISINAHLNVIAKATDIPRSHRRLATYHNRDEVAHARLLREYALQLYPNLGFNQRSAFERALPLALEAFVAQDFRVWSEIFTAVGVRGGEAILADCENASDGRFIRDFSGLAQLVRELGIEHRIDFDFGAYP